MRCDICPLCPPSGEYNDNVCPEMEGSYGLEHKDGVWGCRHPWNWAKKRADEYEDHIRNMGMSMGLEMDEEHWKKEDGPRHEEWREHTIAIMQHALGMDQRKTYKRHGKEYYKPYRNYYTTGMHNFCGWNLLVKRGLATAEYHDGENTYGNQPSMIYYVSDLGKYWLQEQLGIVLKPEE